MYKFKFIDTNGWVALVREVPDENIKRARMEYTDAAKKLSLKLEEVKK